ncbi:MULTISPECIES: MFS transporter [Vibrio]|uniref:MFS transporter n=1 Tax=Vibrio TaxID=662 RepID=UPI002075280F|nr:MULTISPECIES: MFS transporter [Vibrio]USD35288.1 MFS transporter [Vibrio sp. SCSIO 43186]USD48355.1 MFS transporter [Vibrio sp. SCSIO 43145]USD72413.1 MFS transporter [Vibrio sp. SCSIO 43139]USD98091.1 MFS transporter [Vibrio coralliilyticus]
MENILAPAPKARITVPVIALALYAVASGYLMSLIPLMLSDYGLDNSLASWLASVFYAGLLVGAIAIEPLVTRLGHKNAFVLCLGLFIATICTLPIFPSSTSWMLARFFAGIAVAGVFVIVESWLLHGDETARAKRLGLYMAALYGGSALGQLGIGILGIHGGVPFIAISTLLLLAIVVLWFGESDQPESAHTTNLSLKQITRLSHAAIIGCIVSGLILGAIYGLMPLELANQGVAHDDIGGLMALIILGGMAVQPLVPLMSKYFGRTLLMAFFCLLGAASSSMILLDDTIRVLAVGVFLLGVAAFALYPIAINLGCDKLEQHYIVSATQVMLFSYSVGSVFGPIVAGWYMASDHGLMGYLFAILLATCLYMLVASIKAKHQAVAGE